MYILSIKHFNKQLKRQIDNQEQFLSDDVLNRFIMTQAAATLMKSWNHPAALHCLIITQLATTLTKNLNRPSWLHQLDKKTSTDFH